MLYIVKKLREIFDMIHLREENIKLYEANYHRKVCKKKEINPVRTLTSYLRSLNVLRIN